MTRRRFSVATRWMLALGSLLAVGGCDDRSGPTTRTSTSSTSWTKPGAVDPPANPDRPDSCVRCHEAVVNEWRESMHARAHHTLDPIYAGVRKLRIEKEGEAIAKACANCHTPRDLADAESETAKMGVVCGSCHAVREVKDGAHGAAALVPTEGNLLLGPHDVREGKTPAHATGAAPDHMKSPDRLCNACHKELHTPDGIAMCTTGMEHASIDGGPSKGCVDCHMPEQNGPSGTAVARTSHRSHRFLGPHRAWYQGDDGILKAAVDMRAELKPGKLTVTLKNKSQHAVPTGFPARLAVVSVEGLTTEPPKGAVMGKQYVDGDGKPTLAPWAKELKSDTRLGPDEERTIVFAVPAQLARAKVQLVFRLLPPPLAARLGLGEAPEAKPRVVLERIVERGP